MVQSAVDPLIEILRQPFFICPHCGIGPMLCNGRAEPVHEHIGGHYTNNGPSAEIYHLKCFVNKFGYAPQEPSDAEMERGLRKQLARITLTMNSLEKRLESI
jgi:hypothetical protein